MLITDEKQKMNYRNVWVIGEVQSSTVQPVTYELTGAARKLANDRQAEVWVILLGDKIEDKTQTIINYGADKVVIVDDKSLSNFSDEIEAGVLVRLINKYKPEIVICGATARGRALIPRVAVMTESGLTADCTELSIDPQNGDLLQTRPAFGGNIMATIRSSDHRPQMATVRPRVMRCPLEDHSRKGDVIYESVTDSDKSKIKQVLEVFHTSGTTINLADAPVIVAGGRGMKGPEGFELLSRLADKLGGAIGASRAAVDAGWVPYAHQVGQTGQTVQTKVYFACGISGQIQHLVGMQSCDIIIAIDKNPDTPMMQMADIAVVGDIFEVIPAILKELSE